MFRELLKYLTLMTMFGVIPVMILLPAPREAVIVVAIMMNLAIGYQLFGVKND